MDKVHPESSVKERHNGDDMLRLAQKVEEHHLRPLPEAEPPDGLPFPGPVLWGLGLGIVIGGTFGWIFSRLLLAGTIVLPGSEGLFSMFPYAFQVFWIGMGVALGLVIGGIGTILAVPVNSPPPIEKQMREQHEPMYTHDDNREASE